VTSISRTGSGILRPLPAKSCSHMRLLTQSNKLGEVRQYGLS
jgi:hypothetical protein